MEVIIAIVLIILLSSSMFIYSEITESNEYAKEEVYSDYEKLIEQCKKDPSTLNWVKSLNERFERFIGTIEYHTRKPYDEFKFRIPTTKYFGNLVYIVVDKNLDLKFVVNFNTANKDKYLKYAIGYKDGLDEFIKDCSNKVMEHNLEEKKVEAVEKVINW